MGPGTFPDIPAHQPLNSSLKTEPRGWGVCWNTACVSWDEGSPLENTTGWETSGRGRHGACLEVTARGGGCAHLEPADEAGALWR